MAQLATRFAADSSSFGQYVFGVIIMVAIALVAIFLHMTAHEAGHLIFGLLSGYEFVSFRIGSHTLIKQNGKINYKRFTLPGTGGQCLMSPPPYNDGNYPFVLYNLGGVIVNLAIALLFLIIMLALRPTSNFAFSFCVLMIAVGLAVAVLNGIPFNNNLISNDGYNALSLGKNKAALRGFWLSLEVNKLQSEGQRMRDIDESFFDVEDGADLTTPLSSVPLISKENRLMDCKDFDGADQIIGRLLSDECGVVGIHENLLRLDRLYIDVFRNGPAADFSILQNKQMRSFIKAMSSYPAVIRTLYAVSVAKADLPEQNKLLARMNKLSRSYPYAGEMELMTAIAQRAVE